MPHESGSTNDGEGAGVETMVEKQRVYTREQLLELQSSPLSSLKPAIFLQLEKSCCPCIRGVKKKPKPSKPAPALKGSVYDGPGEPRQDGDRSGGGYSTAAPQSATAQARKTTDPRERLKGEEEGIVLSPQRRSFVTGCQAPSIKPKDDESDKDMAGRRLGPARLMTGRDDPRAPRGVERRFDRFDSRMDKPSDHRFDDRSVRGADRRGGGSFGRDWLSGGGYGQGSRRRGDRRPPSSNHRHQDDQQPEWFSAGPTSQDDMIELRGFDDQPAADKSASAAASRPPPAAAIESKQDAAPAENGAADQQNAARAAGNKLSDATQQRKLDASSSALKPSCSAAGAFMDDPAIESTVQHHHGSADLDLDDILRLDLDSLPAGRAAGGGGAASRFSQWFQRQSPVGAVPAVAQPPPTRAPPAAGAAVRPSSLQDELVGNILNGVDGLALNIPATESDTYFAPISPVHSGDKVKETILGLLQRPHQQQQQHHQHAQDSANLALKLAGLKGKARSVAELEADMRPEAPSLQPPQPPHNDVDAFRRLVSQLRESEQQTGGHVAAPTEYPAQFSAEHRAQPASAAVLSRLVRPSPLQPNDLRVAAPPVQQLPAPPPAAAAGPGGSVTQDNLMRLLQVQQQHTAMHNLQHLLSMQRAPSAPPVVPPPMDHLLGTPEARSIISGLQAGRITRQHLIQQLHGQNLPGRMRDVVVAVLRLPQRVSPQPESAVPLPAQHRSVSPLLAHHHQQQQQQHHQQQHHHHQQQHLNVGAPPVPHRGPSPQEMRIHTQHLLQNALIKHKLEEQKENYRRRQETRGAPGPMEMMQDPMRRRVVGPVMAAGGAGVAAGGAGGVPGSLAFTPTSVIRNMQSEARGSPEHRPMGRPLLKANANGPPGGGGIMAPDHLPLPSGPAAAAWLAAAAGGPQLQADNPLSRWFGPELLAGGGMGMMPPGVAMPAGPPGHRVLSVEELEQRHRMH